MLASFLVIREINMVSIAEQLWRCRSEGSVIEVPEDGGPQDLKAALMHQQEAIACSGMRTIGYKVGSTSREAQIVLNTKGPSASPILSEYLFESPATITIYPVQGPAIEGEFALRLFRDLPPREAAYSLSDVVEAVDAVAGAIEIVGSRFVGGLAGKGPFLTAADFGANIALAIGPWNTDWRDLNLAAHDVKVFIDGDFREQGTGARALGNPFNVLKWLANNQSKTGKGLKAGEIISTGTCTGLLDILPGNMVIAKFGSLGSVKIQFT